jgi:hypothetical protein
VGTTSRAQCRMDERACRPFASAGCAVTRARLGDSCWDVTLRCRYRRSLGSDVECARRPIVHSLGGRKAAGRCVGIGRCWDRRVLGFDVGWTRRPVGHSLGAGSHWDVRGGCVGSGCWDATLECRWRRSLGSQMDEIDRCPFLGVDYSSDTAERCVGGDSP